MEKREEINCSRCNKPNCDDWMYHCYLIEASHAVCGECKVEIGSKMKASFILAIKNKKDVK